MGRWNYSGGKGSRSVLLIDTERHFFTPCRTVSKVLHFGVLFEVEFFMFCSLEYSKWDTVSVDTKQTSNPWCQHIWTKKQTYCLSGGTWELSRTLAKWVTHKGQSDKFLTLLIKAAIVLFPSPSSLASFERANKVMVSYENFWHQKKKATNCSQNIFWNKNCLYLLM